MRMEWTAYMICCMVITLCGHYKLTNCVMQGQRLTTDTTIQVRVGCESFSWKLFQSPDGSNQLHCSCIP